MKAAVVFLAIAALVVDDVSGKFFNFRHETPSYVTRKGTGATIKGISGGLVKMPVDHFNPADNRTWNMRAMINPEHFVKGGPIFLYLGGEGPIDPWPLLDDSHIYDMAAQHGGILATTEHRYYGESWPTSDFTTPNMKYLNARQAMADIIGFVKGIQAHYDVGKVVVVGCSYSGSLATWLRAEHPDIIDAAVAASAPLLAIDDFKEFMEIITASIRSEHPTCSDVIREGTAAMEVLYQTEEGRRQLSNLVRSCVPLQPGFPYRDFFFFYVTTTFGQVVQNARPGDIYEMCQRFVSYNGTPLEKLSAHLRAASECTGNYDDFRYSFTISHLGNDNRAWFYQTCNEFGFFQSGNSTAQAFGANWFTSMFHSLCKDAFGEEFTPERIANNIDRTNAYWGGLHPNVTKVISIHGSVDPWHAIGLMKDLNEDAPAFLVKGTAHCAGIYPDQPSDSEELRNVRQTTKKLIAKWIS